MIIKDIRELIAADESLTLKLKKSIGELSQNLVSFIELLVLEPEIVYM